MPLNLPLAATEIPVRIEREVTPAVFSGFGPRATEVIATYWMTPLSDEEYFALDAAAVRKTDPATGKLTFYYQLAESAGLFERKLVRTDVTIDGQPFDKTDPAHTASLPKAHKTTAIMELLIRANRPLSQEELGNWAGSEPASPTAPTPA